MHGSALGGGGGGGMGREENEVGVQDNLTVCRVTGLMG